MKIHYFSGEPWEDAFVRNKLKGHDIDFHEDSLGACSALSDETAEVLSPFIESRIGEEELGRFPSLKLIATRSTGFDHIDLAAASARGIAVANVPSYGENTVAEFAFALMLALSRRIIDADERVRDGAFSPSGLRGFDLAGKTLGVIGTGRIGSHVIRMAKGFDMQVIGFDAYPNEKLANEYGFEYQPLEAVLAAADVVTVHVPYNEQTHHLLNRSTLGALKRGAYLINTSRGAVIETDALVQTLKDGTLAGAGLDVLEDEGDLVNTGALLDLDHPNAKDMKVTIANRYLIEHPRVIVTPHLAFNTKEAVERIVNTTIENIQSFAEGTPLNIVNP